MSNLKELRVRVASVQSTKRITSAMKMVAIAKLRRASETVEKAKPYYENMSDVLSRLSKGSKLNTPLFSGVGKTDTYLLVVVSSDKGLCGGFNLNLINTVKSKVQQLKSYGKEVKIITIGVKGSNSLSKLFAEDILIKYENLNKPTPSFNNAETVSSEIISLLNREVFDVCKLYYNKSLNVLKQVPIEQQLIPLLDVENKIESEIVSESNTVYNYDTSEQDILELLLPKNLTVQIYKSMLESFVAEQSARMSAMDNATNNASDKIKKLSVAYNRVRQASITRELIEIISGAEAL